MERVDLDDLEAVKTSKGNYQRTTKPIHHKGFRSNRIVSWGSIKIFDTFENW